MNNKCKIQTYYKGWPRSRITLMINDFCVKNDDCEIYVFSMNVYIADYDNQILCL